jgi:hypothetical protein
MRDPIAVKALPYTTAPHSFFIQTVIYSSQKILSAHVLRRCKSQIQDGFALRITSYVMHISVTFNQYADWLN